MRGAAHAVRRCEGIYYPQRRMVIVVFAYLCWRNQNQIEMETKTTQRFYQFRGDKMMDTFGIKPVKQCSFLEEWLNAYTNLTDFEDQTL
jgi:hypothetical protein